MVTVHASGVDDLGEWHFDFAITPGESRLDWLSFRGILTAEERRDLSVEGGRGLGAAPPLVEVDGTIRIEP